MMKILMMMDSADHEDDEPGGGLEPKWRRMMKRLIVDCLNQIPVIECFPGPSMQISSVC